MPTGLHMAPDYSNINFFAFHEPSLADLAC